MTGIAQQRDMWMKRLRALVATAACGLCPQHIRQLQQPARRLTHSQPHNPGSQPLPGIIEFERKTWLANTPRELRQRLLLLSADVA